MTLTLIGTSHIAKESEQRIQKYILSEKPDIVAVELDPSRLHSIFQPPRKIRITEIPKIGFMGWAFAVIGSWLQRKFGESVDMVPGADMRIAIITAKHIGAKIALVDRPIQLTLRRLSTEMTLWTKLKFFFYLFSGVFRSEKLEFDLEKVPEEKVIHQLTAELRHKFPALYKVLVTERDEFIAHQLKLLKMQNPDSNIMAVLGAGHLSGVKALLSHRKS